MKQIKKITFLLSFGLSMSCHSTNPNDSIIPAEKLTLLIEDIHLIDAMLLNHSVSKDNKQIQGYYNHIYKKYGITRQDFEASMTYYAKNPKKLRKAYAQITKGLETRDSLLKAAEKSRIDTLELWQGKNSYSFEEYTNKTLPVCIPVEYQKTYTIKAEIKIYSDSQVKEVTPYFAFAAPDTCYVLTTPKIVADTSFQKFEIQEIVSDSTVLDMEGDFFPSKEDGLELFRHYEVRNISISTTVLASENIEDSTAFSK